MKFTRKLRLALAACLALVGTDLAYAYTQPLGGSIFPLTQVTQPVTNLTDAYNEMLALENAQLVANNGGFNSFQGQTIQLPAFSSTLLSSSGSYSSLTGAASLPAANPLVQVAVVNLAASNVGGAVSTGGGVIVASQAGRTIIPLGFQIMASGTVGGATSIQIGCADLTTKMATIPIANLVSMVPVGSYLTSASTSQIVYASGMVTGCSPGQGIVASGVGSAISTTTNFFVSMPYIVQ